MDNQWIYLASEGFEPHLEQELTPLGPWKKLAPRLYSAPAAPPGKEPIWVQNIWTTPEIISFHSIKEASEILRARSGLWVPHITDHHRRSSLIQELLPRFKNKPRTFPFSLPHSNLGAWTLLEENTLLLSPKTSSPFPGGEALFIENRTDPPSSAYLKLWEALTLIDYWSSVPHSTLESTCPGPKDRCLDAGACPGGWTWVLANQGAQVLAVDRSPLEKGQGQRPGVEFRSGDGFKITPDRIQREGWEPFTWILSDMAAYPSKIWDWVELWRAHDPSLKFIITLKMQGEPDWETLDRFREIPGSHLIKLFHNKHEVTWIKA